MIDMKKRLFSFINSKIRIRVSGKNVNNFVKRVIFNNINIYKVTLLSDRDLYLVINYNDLDKVLSIKSIYDIRVINYYGGIRFIKRIYKSRFILLFLGIGFITIYILSNVIFDIEVIHSNSNIVSLINDELYKNGIRKYSFALSYDEVNRVKNKILEDNRSSIEWLEIIKSGTKYIVRVEERIINKPIYDDKIYDIVASKNASIKRISAESGEKVKYVNTYVKKGETIISSSVTLPDNSVILKSARGNVIGEVWYSVRVFYPYVYNETIYTGNKKKVMVFNVLNKRISFFDFNRYKSFKRNVKYIFNNNFIPISFTYEDEYETRVINEIYDRDTATYKGISIAKEKILDKYSSIIDITDVKVINKWEENSGIVMDLFITCDEDITLYKEVEENR